MKTTILSLLNQTSISNGRSNENQSDWNNNREGEFYEEDASKYKYFGDYNGERNNMRPLNLGKTVLTTVNQHHQNSKSKYRRYLSDEHPVNNTSRYKSNQYYGYKTYKSHYKHQTSSINTIPKISIKALISTSTTSSTHIQHKPQRNCGYFNAYFNNNSNTHRIIKKNKKRGRIESEKSIFVSPIHKKRRIQSFNITNNNRDGDKEAMDIDIDIDDNDIDINSNIISLTSLTLNASCINNKGTCNSYFFNNFAKKNNELSIQYFNGYNC